MSDQPKLPYPAWPSQTAKQLKYDAQDKYYWPGKVVHIGKITRGNDVGHPLLQFLIRKREDGMLELKTWRAGLLVPFDQIPEDVPDEGVNNGE